MGRIINIESIMNGVSGLRRKASQDFIKFRKCYFENYHSKPDGIFQKELSELLCDMSKIRGLYAAIAAPRGCAKSTIVSLQYVIYCICHKREEFIVIISSTQDQATGFLRDIKREFETNLKLITDFPSICEIGKKDSSTRWSQSEIITSNGIKVIALSTGQQIRGRRNLAARPTLIILDDIETNEVCRNPESAYKLEDWLNKSVLKSGSEKTNVIFIGTIHHFNSLLGRFTDPKQSAGWINRAYKAVISFAERIDLWEKWSKIYHMFEEYNSESGIDAARKFYEANEKEMLKGVQLLWPESKTYYELMVMKERGGDISFNSEMQNEPINERDCLFRMTDVHYWEEDYKTEEDLIARQGGHLLVYGACDPSLGKDGDSGDFSAIISVAIHDMTKVIYVLDADLARRRPNRTIDVILQFARIRQYVRFGFESNQFQELMAEELRRRADEARCELILKEVKNTTNKRLRIETLQPMIASGKIQFLRKQRALIEELRFYPKGGHDDGLDALQIAVELAYNCTHFPRFY